MPVSVTIPAPLAPLRDALVRLFGISPSLGQQRGSIVSGKHDLAHNKKFFQGYGSMKCVIANIGPLVALLDHEDQDHAWVVSKSQRLPPKMFSGETILSEVQLTSPL